jgi:hypothetical protein
LQVLARLERQRREWDSKLERIKDQDRVARQKAAIDIRVKSGEQLGTTASLGDKVSATERDVERDSEAGRENREGGRERERERVENDPL